MDLGSELRKVLGRAERVAGKPVKIEALAKKLHVSRSTVYAYLDGTTLPSRLVLDKLLHEVGVTGSELGRFAELRDKLDDVRRSSRRRRPANDEPDEFVCQLPPDIRGFTGRREQLAELDNLLAARERSTAVPIAVVCGAPGVGKTALVVHWANLVRDDFPDGLLYVDLRGFDPEQPLDPADVLATLLRSLGVAGAAIPRTLAERSARLRTQLDQRRVLLVLDNAASDEQVRHLVPSSASGVVVVTSRTTLSGLTAQHGAHRIVLNRLRLNEAVSLLRAMVGDERVDSDPLGAEELAERCARLPLALRIGADLTTIRRRSTLRELAAELHRYRLELLSSGGDERTEVRTVFSWSYLHLREDRARAFRLLGLHPGTDIDIHAFAALTGLDPIEARMRIDDLIRANLVEDAGPDRYRMHDLLRAYAVERAQSCSPVDCHEAVGRLLDHYLGAAAVAMDLVAPQEKLYRPEVASVATAQELGTVECAMRWLEAERSNLLATVECAARYGFGEYVLALSATLYRFLDLRAYYADATALHGRALAMARVTGDQNLEGHALYRIGVVYGRLGRHAEAEEHLSRAFKLAAELDNRTLEGRTLQALSMVCMRLGRLADALGHLERALPIARELANRHLEIQVLSNIGFQHSQLGRYDQALRSLTEALELAREVGDLHLQGQALRSLGMLYQRTTRIEEALRCHREALRLARRTGERDLEAWARLQLAQVFLVQWRFTDSISYAWRALSMARETGNRDLECYTRATLARVCMRCGGDVDAVENLRAALDIVRETGNRDVEMDALNAFGEVLVTQDPTAALEYCRRSLALSVEIGDPWQQARSYEGIAYAFFRLGRSADAKDNHLRATQIYARLGFRADL